MKFIPTDYTERHVIHCLSEEAWDKVVEVLDRYGLRTASGHRFKDWSWNANKCIRFMAGTHGSLGTYTSEPYSYVILEYDDFEWEEKPLTIDFRLDELFK